MTTLPSTILQRQRITVQGKVQGVGFRPFVYGQAVARNLTGFVQNTSEGVIIEVEGTPQALVDFQHELFDQLPPLARIESLTTEFIPFQQEAHFKILHSQSNLKRLALIPPDAAICHDCLYELFDPSDRRYLYPFINCTNCGPRFTIIEDIPYDREKTTMRIFPMCPSCEQEYNDPLNRRFHAQPNACPLCGPQILLLEKNEHGLFVERERPMSRAAQLLAVGAIVAIKGLGGYHLACDALSSNAVELLRQRKHREAKPFALMVPDIETAGLLCSVNDAEARLLQSYQRPIVLLKRKDECPVASAVAPVSDTLGIMLAYTPLHHVLLHEYATLKDAREPTVLVMTSANLSDEPIAYQDDDARERLAPLVEGMLIHNREIYRRCDDSVVRIAVGGNQIFRRSRGYAPEPIELAFDLPTPMLACGAHLKNTFCLGKGRNAFLSQHIGDLDQLETLTAFREEIERLQYLFAITPQAVAYDLHPKYQATRYALDSSIPENMGIQHHHAHIASVMAEHGLVGPVIGIAADGTGYGTDGAIWGCEILIADLLDFERYAHLDYVPLPGGEQAVRQPWRMGAVYLSRAYGASFLELDIPFTCRIDRSKWHTLSQMMVRNVNCPQTSSLGRLFDAVAALIGFHDEVWYEGQAAIELEMLAAKWSNQITGYPSVLRPGSPVILDVLPVIDAIVKDIVRGEPPGYIARRFHLSVAQMFTSICVAIRTQKGLNTVALSGGVFQNRLLLEQLLANLEMSGFQVFINRRVPPNDGGLSLGQLAIAAARLQKQRSKNLG